MSEKRQGVWYYLKFAVALLLFAAAGAKVLQIAEILSGDGLLASKPLLLAAIAFEVAIGAYLLEGNPFWSWTLTLATFSIFSLAAGYAMISGTHCNCISVEVGPQVMLSLDIAVLFLAGFFRPSLRYRKKQPSIPRIAICVVAGILVAGVACLHDLSTDRADPIQFLLADEWVDKPWPLGAAFHPLLADLETGRWLVLVVRRDCEHCRQMLDLHFLNPANHREGERTALFVAGNNRWPFAFDEVSLDTEPDRFIQWPVEEPFVASPAAFVLHDGNVKSAADGTESHAFMEDLMMSTDTDETLIEDQ